eukprot:UC1_evm1s1894
MPSNGESYSSSSSGRNGGDGDGGGGDIQKGRVLSRRLMYDTIAPATKSGISDSAPPRRISLGDGGPALMLLDESQVDSREIRAAETLARQRSAEMHALEQNVSDLNGMFQTLLTHVRTQGDTVDDIERNMERADGEVHKGVGHLLKARRYTTAAWPLAGALVGALVLGPVGLVLGAKSMGAVAGLAAGGAAVGSAGGAALGRREAKKIEREENEHRDRAPL